MNLFADAADTPQPRYAHSANPAGRMHLLKDHLRHVALKASQFAEALGMSEEAYAAGLLHDLGKYGGLFQKRLRGEADHVDHWSAGAWQALLKYRQAGIAPALAIQGHHLGLAQGSPAALRQMDPKHLMRRHPQGLTLSSDDIDALAQLLESDGLCLPGALDASCHTARPDKAAAMLDIRMLFSALADADFLDTEAHFSEGHAEPKSARRRSPTLQPEKAFELLQSRVDCLQRTIGASNDVAALRASLYSACVGRAASPTGLYTLSAPTGSGKTLAMLAFALRHAAIHDLRRIVCVIPYLSIIEQTAAEYRVLFEDALGPNYILEHHSLSGTHRNGDGGDTDDHQDPAQRAARLLSENWDAPLIVTTSVQCLESLMASRPSACRKLHRLARSVILFDEVQTLPQHLAVATLATLSHLSQRFGTTIVFSTATQPAFTALDEQVRRLCATGWSPSEIVPASHTLFGRIRRTRVRWPEPGQTVSWDALAERLRREPQALCIVNLRRHARRLFEALRGETARDGLFHLSTSMCPAHRTAVLTEVRRRLDAGAPCRLIATQCVEAGVDLDFPTVWRAFGPLEAVAQAAGRCNRRGLMDRPGEVFVFFPEAEDGGPLYPPGGYKQGADITRTLLLTHSGDVDIDSPQLFDDYYRQLYGIGRAAHIDAGKAKTLCDAMKCLDFQDTAMQYRLIDADAVNVVVPYATASFEELAHDVQRDGLTARWIARARPHAVSVFRPGGNRPLAQILAPVPLAGRKNSDDWFLCLGAEHYDPDTGLLEPDTWQTIV